jgi:hypothetical protein
MDKIKIGLQPYQQATVDALNEGDLQRFVDLNLEARAQAKLRMLKQSSLKNVNAIYGKGAGSFNDPGIGNFDNKQLREYISRDIEYTESARKFFETEQIIAEALEMQRRGRPAPIPRPTYLAVAIRAIYDNLESWSLK